MNWQDRVGVFLFESGSARAAALFRIAVGSVIVLTGLAVLRDVPFFYGDAGVAPGALLGDGQRAEHLSLLHRLSSPGAVRVLHSIYLLAAALTALGLFTRAATVGLFVLTLSFRHANPMLANNAEQLLTIATFWLMFLDSDRRWSVSAVWRWKGAHETGDRPWRGCAALRMLQFQCVFMYGVLVLQKLRTGGDWADGTTMFYFAANVYEWNVPMTWMLDHPFVYRAATYGPIGLECLFPILVWWRPARPYLLATMAIFHGVIFYAMGITHYSLAALALLTVFVPLAEEEIRDRT